ncbi:MAG: 1-acyl-sn-glycerol-3-phosphate acyltransferase [Elusimicrobia bacterium]|nr:1-acyl-sn-glycerol-3-phosphate acyltransferase [Elusimicrobiota bacterium]
MKACWRKRWLILVHLLGFGLFGLSSIISGWTLFPVLALWPGSANDRRDRVQRVIHIFFRCFIDLLEWSGGMKPHKATGFGSRTGPQVVVANHPTLLDIVFLLAHMPQGDCVVKKELGNNPLIAPILWAAGYIRNADGQEALQEAVTRLQAGRRVIWFPEGTRSPENGLGPFHRGFAHAALRAGCPVVPVVIQCRPRALGRRHQPIYDIPSEPFRLTLRMGDPIWTPREQNPSRSPAVTARAISLEAEDYFRSELTHA